MDSRKNGSTICVPLPGTGQQAQPGAWPASSAATAHRLRRTSTASVLVFGLLFLTGCGSDRATAPVSGTVKMNGKPFANASLTFQPIGGGMASTGLTDANGRYTLKFLYSEDEGAIVTTHRVIIRTSKKSNTEDTSSDRADPSARDPIPRRYNDMTELTMEVPADGTDSANFDLKSP